MVKLCKCSSYESERKQHKHKAAIQSANEIRLQLRTCNYGYAPNADLCHDDFYFHRPRKEKGTMEVLLVSPTRPLMIIIAKVVPYLVLAFVILIAILLMATFVLGVPVQGSLFWIFLISTIYILLALSLGLLVSTIAQTQLVALLLSAMVLLMPIVMFSGMIFPIESMPQILQYASIIIPTRYYISAMRKLMIMGVGVEQVYHEMIILTSMLVVLLFLSLAKFNKRLE